VLWSVLAFLWLLFLPQALVMASSPRDISVPGAVFWAVVLAWLLSCVWMTWRRYRRERADGAAGGPQAS
jgi:hypothetical protein